MPYPSRAEYTEAVRDFPQISILDSKLKDGNALRAADRNLIAYSGGFSIVFPIEVSSNTYALRCWIQDIENTETRYQAISDYLKQRRLPYFVDFDYVAEGILVNGTRYPITRMKWAEGETLCNFIEQNLQDAKCLKTAATEFQKMVKTLHDHQISHGDLQDGNILLKRNGTDVEIKLIDYDSLCVPALRGQPDSIVGLPEYQHPQRIAGGGEANKKVDYFSELVIYLSFLSLAENPDLWNRFGERTEKGLLFTTEDFKNPDQSAVFQELENLSSNVKQLASKLKKFCKLPIGQLEALEAILPRTSPAQAIYEQGIAYRRAGQYSKAVIEFKKAVAIDPNFKEAYHGLGLAYFQMGNLGEAKKNAEAALGIDPYYQPAFQLLGVIKSFSATSVTSLPSPAVTPKPSSTKQIPHPSPPRSTSRATSTKQTSQPVKPRSTFLNRVLNLWQSITPNHWQYMTGALAFALVICMVAIATQTRKLQNENTSLRDELDQLTQIDIKSGRRFPPVNSSFRAAPPQTISYNNSQVKQIARSKNNRGFIHFNANMHNIALGLFQDAINNQESTVIHYNLGCTYLVMRKSVKAVDHLQKAVIFDPNFKEAYYNLALAWFRIGDYQKAIDAARKALNIDENYQSAQHLLEAIE